MTQERGEYRNARLIGEGYNCSFLLGNAEILPYKSSIFDKVVSVCALEHFKNDDAALEEMHRVLKPGGILVLTVDSFTYRGIKNGSQQSHWNNYHIINYYSDSLLAEKLGNAGFEVEESKYFVNSPIAAFFFNIGIRLRFGVPFMALFPIAYPLSVLSDRFLSRRNEGYLLAIKARRREQPCGNSI